MQEHSPSKKRAKNRGKKITLLILTALFALVSTTPAYAMHISEGVLPLPWAVIWSAVALLFVLKGLREVKRSSTRIAAFVPLVGMMAAALFIVSSLPIPVPTAGTSSHPAGTGLAAILIGPFATIVCAAVALLFQALFLAHGGISSWGADIVSLGVVGAFTGFFVFKLLTRFGVRLAVAAFLAGLLSDWATYAVASLQLSLALGGTESFITLFKAIFITFIPTQLPIAILEGVAAAGIFTFVLNRRPDILEKLGVIPVSPAQSREFSEAPAYETLP